MDFLLKITACFHYHFVTITSTKLFLFSTCTHFREFPRYRNNNWFLSVTLRWLKQHQCQTCYFAIPETQLSSSWKLKGKIFFILFLLLTNEKETLKLLKWLSKAIIVINWFRRGALAGMIVAEHIKECKCVICVNTPKHVLNS